MTLRVFVLGAVSISCFSFFIQPVSAAEKNGQDRMKALGTANPHVPKLEDMAKSLFDSVGQDEAKRIAAFRNGYSMLRAVDVVKREVGTTVGLCSKANPEMKKDMDDHFTRWQDTVSPVAADQKKRMEKALNKDNFTHPDDVRAFLEQLDKTAAYAEAENEKSAQRVTDKQACSDLIKSMDENDDKIASALQKIKWPGEDNQSAGKAVSDMQDAEQQKPETGAAMPAKTK